MTCREFIDFLSDYLGGGLPRVQRDEFDRHLAICPACVDYLRSFEQTLRLERVAYADPDGPVPGGVPEALVQAVLASRSRKD